MARFATVSKNELEKLLADKDAENKESDKKSDKAGCEQNKQKKRQSWL